jgi:hypothetical protein
MDSNQIEAAFQKLLVHPIPSTGNVKIARENLAHWSDNDFTVHQHGSEFRFSSTIGQKVDISAKDGLWLIEQLKLGASMIRPFRRAVIWSNSDV